MSLMTASSAEASGVAERPLRGGVRFSDVSVDVLQISLARQAMHDAPSDNRVVHLAGKRRALIRRIPPLRAEARGVDFPLDGGVEHGDVGATAAAQRSSREMEDLC